MTDRLSPDRRRALMQKIKSSNTQQELMVRSMLHRLGFRFRIHRKDLPGTPDIVLPGRRIVLFVHGCFWHGHGCRIGALPKSNLDYWKPKIEANRARDQRTEAELASLGWRVVTVWQCELSDMETLSKRLMEFLAPV